MFPLLLRRILWVALPLALLVGGSTAAQADHGAELWAGQWTTSTGGVAWRAFNEDDLEIAKKGKDRVELFDKLPCKNGPQFYRGGYTAGADRGKIMGCGTPTYMRGRWLSNVGGSFQNGSYEIRITSRKPLKFSGTFTQDDGVTGKYTGTWASHFDGDGCCGAAKPPPPTCTRTYVVEPGGARIQANVKNTELTAKQVAAVLAREKGKYEGWDYTPIGEVTRKVNCAGFVMLKLFGRQMVDANVDPDPFFRAIVKPFGSKRISRATARAGDVVVWRTGGVVKHVAFVEAGGVRPTILTKDQNERLYRMKLAIDPRGEEPLAQAHGSIEFWQVDRSKVKITVVDGEDCGK